MIPTEYVREDVGRQPGHAADVAWLATFKEFESAASETGRGLELLSAPPDWSPWLADTPHCRVAFDGVLYNRRELQELCGRRPDPPGDAELVGEAYRRWGEDAIGHLKGVFALIIADRTRNLLLCARDPLGIRPLFYADVGHLILFSPSIETLIAHPGASAELN